MPAPKDAGANDAPSSEGQEVQGTDSSHTNVKSTKAELYLEKTKAKEAARKAVAKNASFRQGKGAQKGGKGGTKGGDGEVGHVSIRDAREGNYVLREMVDLERTIIGIFNSEIPEEEEKKKVFAVCQGYYLKKKYSANPQIVKTNPTKNAVTTKPTVKTTNAAKKAATNADSPSAGSYTKEEKEELQFLIPTKLGALHRAEHGKVAEERLGNLNAIRSQHKKAVKDLLARNVDNDEFNKRVKSILKIANHDKDILVRVDRLDFQKEKGKPKIGVYPDHLCDENRMEVTADNDAIAKYLYERLCPVYRESGMLSKELNSTLVIVAQEFRYAYALLWYHLQSPEVQKNKNLKGCVETRDIADLSSDRLRKIGARLFDEAVSFWKRLIVKMDPGRDVDENVLHACAKDGAKLSDLDVPLLLLPINQDKSRRMGRANARICMHFGNEKDDFSCLKNLSKTYTTYGLHGDLVTPWDTDVDAKGGEEVVLSPSNWT